MAGDTNTQIYENVSVQPQNLNVKILLYYDVMLHELSMESSVNEGKTRAKHFSVKILEVFMLCSRTYNKCYDFNTTEFKCDNTQIHFT